MPGWPEIHSRYRQIVEEARIAHDKYTELRKTLDINSDKVKQAEQHYRNLRQILREEMIKLSMAA